MAWGSAEVAKGSLKAQVLDIVIRIIFVPYEVLQSVQTGSRSSIAIDAVPEGAVIRIKGRPDGRQTNLIRFCRNAHH